MKLKMEVYLTKKKNKYYLTDVKDDIISQISKDVYSSVVKDKLYSKNKRISYMRLLDMKVDDIDLINNYKFCYEYLMQYLNYLPEDIQLDIKKEFSKIKLWKH